MIEGIVTIVGRPNVGKSTLFNKMTHTNTALIDDRPGVTRDRIYGTVSSVLDDDSGYILVDTGGFETENLYYQPFAKNIVWEQTLQAINDADLVLMVFDAKSGLHPHDKQLVQLLKESQKPTLYVVNKIDGSEQASRAFEFYELGIESYLMTCATHSTGLWELSEAIESQLKALKSLGTVKRHDKNATKVALIGRPNAGKSSILNRLCGEDRSLVSEVAGTTRDPIDTSITYNRKPYVLLDTAGIRRRTKISDRIEGLSVLRSLRAIEDADVVVLVITADEGLSDQDCRLASLAAEKYKPLLIVVNKWDLVLEKTTNTARDYERAIHNKLSDLSYIPIIFTSCLENQRIHRIMAVVEELATAYERRISTSKLNDALQKAVHEHTPALLKRFNKRVKFYFATQVTTKPPTIVVKCNVADEIQESYKRYLTKRLRSDLDFGHVPLRLFFRDKGSEQEEREYIHS